jgi:tRNA pseudouridine55 synthase
LVVSGWRTLVDKPSGLTSHDVVAIARRALHETRIGHTGTLDPLATGVLPLACGRATRLVRFLIASDKDYDAVIRFGLVTDTYDVTGAEKQRSDLRPSRQALEEALASLCGEHLQTPPPFSAKKVAGTRAYELARRDVAVELAPVPVSVMRANLVRFEGEDAAVAITCSAGFYVRSFAHELGQRLGTGACLAALRRTRSGQFVLADAATVEEVRSGGAATRMLRLESLMPSLPAATVTGEGRERVGHGREVDAAHCDDRSALDAAWVRLLDREGQLIALAQPGTRPGSLHPAVVLI